MTGFSLQRRQPRLGKVKYLSHVPQLVTVSDRSQPSFDLVPDYPLLTATLHPQPPGKHLDRQCLVEVMVTEIIAVKGDLSTCEYKQPL